MSTVTHKAEALSGCDLQHWCRRRAAHITVHHHGMHVHSMKLPAACISAMSCLSRIAASTPDAWAVRRVVYPARDDPLRAPGDGAGAMQGLLVAAAVRLECPEEQGGPLLWLDLRWLTLQTHCMSACASMPGEA